MGESIQGRSYSVLISIIFSILLFAPLTQAAVVINEVLPNGLLEPQSEWVELYNDGNAARSLNGWNLTEQGANGNVSLNVTIPAQGFIVLVRDFSVFNTTFPNKNSTGLVVAYGSIVPSFQLGNTAGTISLYNQSGELVDNVSYASTSENVSFGRYRDGSQTILSLPTLTPGTQNDNQPPTLNTWSFPPSHNSNVAGVANITLNATDDASAVALGVLAIQGSNFSMQQNGDIWYFLWNTSLAQNGKLNLTVTLADSYGQKSSDALYNITVDNLNPRADVIAPQSLANVSGNLNISISSSDTLTSVGSVRISNGTNGNSIPLSLAQGTAANGVWSLILSTLPMTDGPQTFTINATDVLGNQNVSESVTVLVDNAAPTTGSVSSSPLNPTTSTNVTLSASFSDSNGILTAIFEHNASGIKQNVTGTRISGDNFSIVISNALLSSREFVGWKAHGVDHARNIGQTPLQTFSVPNRAPLSATIQNQSWQQNTNKTLSMLPFFTDPDNDSLIFSAVSIPQNISIQINGSTVRFVPDNDFSGVRTVEINATDGEMSIVSNTFALNVTFINTYAPQLSTIPNITFAEDGYNASLNLSDFVFDLDTPDEQISWSTSAASPLVVSINPTTRILNISTVANFNGTRVMQLVASDGSFQASSNNFTITSTPINDAPSTPTLFAPADGANFLVSSATLSWNAATDIDGPAMSYQVYVGTTTSPLLNTTTSSTSLLLTNLQNAQTYFWRVSATDGLAASTNSTERSFTINSNNTPLPPQFTTLASGNVQAGQPFSYDADATDPNGDVATFTLVVSPAGMAIQPTNGMVTWTPTSAQIGSHAVSIQATDGTFNVTQNFTVAVNPTPPPSILVGGKLAITDLDVKIDGKKSTNVRNNSAISKEAKPGSQVEFDLEVENLFTKSEDLDIEDIEVNINIFDIDDGDDLDDEAKTFDLKHGDSEKVSVEFTLPLEVDEDTYDVEITVEGEDENGTTHTVEALIFLDVEKEKHELRIIKASATPPTIRCEETAHLPVSIINTGKEDEEEARVTVTSLDFGWDVEQGFEVNEGGSNNRYEHTFLLPVPKGLEDGVYTAEVTAYYDTSKMSETSSITFQKEACIKVEQATQHEQALAEAALTKQIQEAQQQAVQQQLAQQNVQQEQKPARFRDTPEYEFLLISGVVTASAMLMIIMVAVVVLL